jgi:murein DD-endopeptidase MepM/ murein hydrolase activator NlpD
MALVKHVEIVGNQLKLYYDDNTTAMALPTMGSMWLVAGESTGGGGTPEPVNGNFAWPYPLGWVSDEFGLREDVGRWHEGIDMAGGPASYGNPIPAIGAGSVIHSGSLGGFGQTTIIDHGTLPNGVWAGMRVESLYAHQVSTPPVGVGATVTLGQTIGYINNSGSSFGSHLHMEIHVIPPGGSRIGDYLNPNPAPPSNRTAVDPRIFMNNYNPTGAVLIP